MTVTKPTNSRTVMPPRRDSDVREERSREEKKREGRGRGRENREGRGRENREEDREEKK